MWPGNGLNSQWVQIELADTRVRSRQGDSCGGSRWRRCSRPLQRCSLRRRLGGKAPSRSPIVIRFSRVYERLCGNTIVSKQAASFFGGVGSVKPGGSRNGLEEDWWRARSWLHQTIVFKSRKRCDEISAGLSGEETMSTGCRGYAATCGVRFVSLGQAAHTHSCESASSKDLR